MGTAFTSTTIHGRQNYEQRDIEVTITNGTGNVSLVLRLVNALSGTYVNLTPEQARALAADLTARADSIEGID